MDPLLFGINADVVGEVLGTLVLLSLNVAVFGTLLFPPETIVTLISYPNKSVKST